MMPSKSRFAYDKHEVYSQVRLHIIRISFGGGGTRPTIIIIINFKTINGGFRYTCQNIMYPKYIKSVTPP